MFTPNPLAPMNAMTTGPKLPDNYGFNDLADYEQNQRTAFGKDLMGQVDRLRTGIGNQYDTTLKNYQDTSATRRSALASSLTDTAKNEFNLMNPSILEDLNKRGVFTSPTAVNTAQAQALKELAVKNQDTLNNFDTSTRGFEDTLGNQKLADLNSLSEAGVSGNIQAQLDALNSGMDLRSSKLESDLQAAQSAREEALARDLASKQGRNQLTNSLIGAGTTIGGSLLTAKMLGGALHPAAATTALNVGSATPGVLGGTTAGTLGGVPLATAGAPASSLFPGGLGAVGTPSAGSTVGAGGGGLATLGGVAAIGGAGIGSALLSRAAQNKVAGATGSNSLGSAAGVLANPIGAQLNVAKSLVTNPKKALSNASKSLGFGAGKTADGNAIADASRSVQAQQNQLLELKKKVASGEMSQEEYLAQAQPVVDAAASTVGNMASRGSKYATPINKMWQMFQDAGLVQAQNGQWVAV